MSEIFEFLHTVPVDPALAVGGEVIGIDFVNVFEHPWFVVTVRLTLKVPPEAKTCVGFCWMEKEASPKSQLQFVMVAPVTAELSVKLTTCPAQVLAYENKAAGCGLMVTVLVVCLLGHVTDVVVDVNV